MKIELTRIEWLNIYVIVFSIINCMYINQWSSDDCVVGINIIMLLIHDKDFFFNESYLDDANVLWHYMVSSVPGLPIYMKAI